MIIKLKKLYSNPEVFTPVIFKSGVNIVLGEKVENSETVQNKKTNGVGKSVFVEFINFCLLKDFNKSRVSLIPKDFFYEFPYIMLDLEINGLMLTISRSTENPENITIIEGKRKQIFNNLNDAKEYFNNFIQNSSKSIIVPSFREVLAPIIRNEMFGFNNIIQTDASGSSYIVANLRPHLYFFGIDLQIYKNIKDIMESISETSKVINKVKSDLGCSTKGQIDKERAKLNALTDEVDKMKDSIDAFKTMDSFEKIQDEIVKLEAKLDIFKVQRKTIKAEINKLETMPEYEDIDEQEVKMVYDYFKEGLGEKLLQSLEQVKLFKSKIDDFQKSLIKERYTELDQKLKEINSKIEKLDDLYSQKMKVIDVKGIFKDIKISFNIYDKKNEELSEKRYKLGEYDKNIKLKEAKETKRDEYLVLLRNLLDRNDKKLKDFEGTILNMHNFVMGNKEASFRLEPTKKKDVIEFNYRIKDDGSLSTNKIKVFLYDLALMFNAGTKVNHPNFLIHDNILQVDEDSLVRSLNLLDKLNAADDFQYILTINKDFLDLEEIRKNVKLNIEENTIARFTKEEQFLKRRYVEK